MREFRLQINSISRHRRIIVHQKSSMESLITHRMMNAIRMPAEPAHGSHAFATCRQGLKNSCFSPLSDCKRQAVEGRASRARARASIVRQSDRHNANHASYLQCVSSLARRCSAEKIKKRQKRRRLESSRNRKNQKSHIAYQPLRAATFSLACRPLASSALVPLRRVTRCEAQIYE